jgi:hypothetical protein
MSAVIKRGEYPEQRWLGTCVWNFTRQVAIIPLRCREQTGRHLRTTSLYFHGTSQEPKCISVETKGPNHLGFHAERDETVPEGKRERGAEEVDD